MKTKAAVLHEVGKPMEIEELDLDGPREGEVLIRYTHAGMCHSDVHIVHGDLPARYPIVLGHEGAGIIEEVGPGVTRVRPGDKVVCSFIPSCGTLWVPVTLSQPLAWSLALDQGRASSAFGCAGTTQSGTFSAHDTAIRVSVRAARVRLAGVAAPV